MEEEERPRKLQKVQHEDSAGGVKIATPIAVPEPHSMLDENKSPRDGDAPSTNATSDKTTGVTTVSEDGEMTNATLSKNQLKKLKKLERWEAGREWRKEKRKEKMKARKERERAAKIQAAAQGASDTPEQEQPEGRITLRQLRRTDNGRSCLLPITFLLDCDFDDLMMDKERKSLASQITRSYSDNSRARFRAHLVVSSFNKLLKERFDTVLTKQYERWKGVTITEDDFVVAADAAQERMKHPKSGRLAGVFGNKAEEEKTKLEEQGEIVYLTSDSPDTLTELKPYSTYIIGGLVDKNRHKGICYKRAVEKGIKTAKLPIGDFMQMSSRYVLATNHVVEIMVRWLELGDWGLAFDRVIPKRKGGTLKSNGNGEEAKNLDIEDQAEEEHASPEEDSEHAAALLDGTSPDDSNAVKL